jgi:hypothetical protein
VYFYLFRLFLFVLFGPYGWLINSLTVSLVGYNCCFVGSFRFLIWLNMIPIDLIGFVPLD